MKNTKRNLVTSLITLLICFTMLVGTTFAWFTDTVSNTGNKIKAGTLDISLWKYDGGEFKDISDDENPIFSYDKWEPGYSSGALLKIQNDGNLSFKFKAIIKPIGELTVNAEGHTLADAIDVYSKVVDDTFEMPTSFDDVKSGEGWTVTNLKDVISDNDGIAYGILLAKDDDATPDASKLEAKGSVPMAIVLHMKEEAGNEYQGMSLGTSFDIQVLATQYNHEIDGFNNHEYDLFSDYPVIAESKYVSGESTTLVAYGDDNKQNAKVTIPADAEIPVDTEKIVMIIDDTEKPKAIILEEGQDSLNVDISFYSEKSDGTRTQIKDFGEEHAASVDLSAVLPDGMELVKVYNTHDLANPIPFTRVGSKEAVVDGTFYYDSSTKTMYLASSKFSPFTFVVEQCEVIVTKDGDDKFTPVGMSFVEFRQSILDTDTYGYYEGYTATLQKDVDLSSTDMSIFGEDNSLFAGTFDGNNHSISNFNMICEDGSEIYASLFYYMYNATVKNLIIKDSTLDHAGNASSLLVYQPYGDTFTIDKLQIKNCKITNGWDSAIIGYANTATDFVMTNCSVDEDSYIENIYGNYTSAFFNQTCWNESVLVKDCTNKADIVGRAYTGAFFCQVGAGIEGPVVFENCINEGDVYSLGRDNVGTNYTGGFVGYHNSGSIGANASISYINCANSGSVTGDANTTKVPGIGGFVGYSAAFDVTFTNCSLASNQLGKSDTIFCGGYIGWMNGGAVVFDNCSMTCSSILGINGKTGNYVGQNPSYATIYSNCNPSIN